MRAAIRTFLEKSLNMTVCGEAADGVEAIEKNDAQHPGLILMDIAMPRMNGVEAASIIKKHSPGAYIVAFTLYPDAIMKSMARAAGVDLVVSKAEGTEGLERALSPFV
jgi:DNA-binding NarL/FixJ family response regulator